MKYFLVFLLAANLFACSFKQKQFVTTLSITDTAFTEGQADTATMVISKRLEGAGIHNASVKVNYKTNEITIQSAKPDREWVQDFLLKKGALVFYECYSIFDIYQGLEAADKLAAAKLNNGVPDSMNHPLLGEFTGFAVNGPNTPGQNIPGFIGYAAKGNIPRIKESVNLGKDVLPADALMMLQESGTTTKDKQKMYEIYFVRDNSTKLFANNHVTKAETRANGKHTDVLMQFDAYGAYLFKRMTMSNVGKTIAMTIDGAILSAPKVLSPIEGGSVALSGVFEKKEAKDMAALLASGCLPVNMVLKGIEEVKTAE
ncbi:SecDF P1 head subdomain-containing protein [Ferruginibacter sp.]